MQSQNTIQANLLRFGFDDRQDANNQNLNRKMRRTFLSRLLVNRCLMVPYFRVFALSPCQGKIRKYDKLLSFCIFVTIFSPLGAKKRHGGIQKPATMLTRKYSFCKLYRTANSIRVKSSYQRIEGRSLRTIQPVKFRLNVSSTSFVYPSVPNCVMLLLLLWLWLLFTL